MSPKEKANELVRKFSSQLPWYSVKDNLNKSKQCALIAVEELITHSRNTAIVYDLSFDESENYWTKVKNEIELL